MKLFNTGIVLRITGLWAFSEAFMGGILHGFKIPFAGLVLSLVASICMSLIAVNEKNRGAILRATLAVIAIKFMLSPHTPPMAYAAVLIEGLAGELFFFWRKQIKTSAFFLTMFCLLYSAFQHLLILTIVFGKDFWMALDVFLNGITKTFIRQQQHYSLYLVLFYITCYFLAGIFGGILNCRIIAMVQSGMEPKVVSRLKTEYPEGINSYNPAENNKNTARHTLRYVLAAILFIILLLSYSSIFDNTIVKTKAGQIILRGILIVIVWWFLISPLLVRVIKNWVIKYKKGKGAFVQEILSLFPDIRKIVLISWKMSSKANRFKRVPEFIENTMLLTVYGK